MTTLHDLLEQAKQKRQVTSGRALAELAQRHGYSDYRTQINQILKRTYKSRPSPTLLEAIAWLAGVQVEEAYAAAELPMPGPPFVEELPANSDYLLPHERRVVVDVIRGFLTSHELEQRLDLSWEDRAGLSTFLAVSGADAKDFTPEALARRAAGSDPEPTEETLHNYRALEEYLSDEPRVTVSAEPGWPIAKRTPQQVRDQVNRALSQTNQYGFPEQLAEDTARLYLQLHRTIEEALIHAHQMHDLSRGSAFTERVLAVLQEWEDDEELLRAARQTPDREPTPHQRLLAELEGLGEESQDHGQTA